MPRPVLLRWLSAVVVTALLLKYMTSLVRHDIHPTSSDVKIYVPKDLETHVMARFDELVRRGKILFERTESELFTESGFEVT